MWDDTKAATTLVNIYLNSVFFCISGLWLSDTMPMLVQLSSLVVKVCCCNLPFWLSEVCFEPPAWLSEVC